MSAVTLAAYMGAKYWLASILASMMVYMEADRYVDLFGGVGNLFIQKPSHKIEIYNDLDSDLCCLFRQLSTVNGRLQLLEHIFSFQYDRETHSKAQKILENGLQNSKISESEYAAYVWYVLLSSFNGNKKGKFRGISDKMNETKFRSKIFHKLDAIERFEGIEVTNRNALDIIIEETPQKELSSKTMYFLDSPYFENKAGYSHNMIDCTEHIHYCELVGQLGGYKMVCGYDNPVYQRILVEKYGFYKYFVAEVAASMRIGGGDVPKGRREEYIWLSYPTKGGYKL